MTFKEWAKTYNDGILQDDTLTASAMRGAAQDAWNVAQPQWQPIETAPKDGTLFLADIGYPWPVIACWSGTSEQWAFADFNMGMFEGEWNDPYFETEWEKPEGLKAWQPLPTIGKTN